MRPRDPEPVPRLALTLLEAAVSMGVSLSSFRRHVLPTIRTNKVGNAVVVSSEELSRWLYSSATVGDND